MIFILVVRLRQKSFLRDPRIPIILVAFRIWIVRNSFDYARTSLEMDRTLDFDCFRLVANF